MTIKEIALKNLARRKGKAAFILAGLVIGVATVVAVITFADSMTRDINHNLEKYGANILILPRTDDLTLSYGGMSLGGVPLETEPIRQSQLIGIHSIKNADNIAAVGPLVLGSIKVGSQSVLLAGVDLGASAILKPWWKINGRTPVPGELLLGSEAARILNAAPGQRVTVNQQAMKVAGVLAATGSQDDQLAFTHLQTAQNLLGKPDEVSMVEVAALCNACPIDDMVGQIAEKLPDAKVMAIQQVVKGRMETLAHFKKFSFGLSVVVVLIGGLVVLVTLMGSVKERTREIGIFRAIGFRRRHIMNIIFIETGLISTLAGVLGYLIGVAAIWAGFSFFSDQHVSVAAFNPYLAAGSIMMALTIGMLACAYPASMAARMDPNQALMTL